MDRDDPYAQYNFLVEANGITRAGFSEVSGLTAEQDIIEYREGSETATVRKLPGLRKYSNIMLKRGMTNNTELWEWRLSVINGQTVRMDGAIILLNEARVAGIRYEFSNAFPSKLTFPTLNATANEAAIEEMELTIEDLRMEVL